MVLVRLCLMEWQKLRSCALSEMLLLLWEVAVMFEVAEYDRHWNVNDVSTQIRSCIWHVGLFQAEWLFQLHSDVTWYGKLSFINSENILCCSVRKYIFRITLAI
jgi:hypothetical protein